MSTPDQQPNPYSPETSGGLTGWERPDTSAATPMPTSAPSAPLPPYTPEPAPASSSAWTPAAPATTSYPAAPGYGYGYPVAPEQPKGNLGVIGLGLALGALVTSIILSVMGGLAFQKFYELTGETEFDSNHVPAGAEGPAMTMGWTTLAQIFPTLLGISALVVSIIALARPDKNKPMAIIGLVISIIAPIISFVVFASLIPQT